jgi:hypothetical protein
LFLRIIMRLSLKISVVLCAVKVWQLGENLWNLIKTATIFILRIVFVFFLHKQQKIIKNWKWHFIDHTMRITATIIIMIIEPANANELEKLFQYSHLWKFDFLNLSHARVSQRMYYAWQSHKSDNVMINCMRYMNSVRIRKLLAISFDNVCNQNLITPTLCC